MDKLPEGGPPISADRCVPFGTDDGRDVYKCFEDESSVGCFFIGESDNLIVHECSAVTRNQD